MTRHGMTGDDEFVAQLKSYLDEYEGITPLPHVVRDAVRAEIPMTSQQRRSGWLAWRFSHMSNTVRYALAAAAVVAVALIGYQLLIAPNVGGPNPSPSPSAGPTSTSGPTGGASEAQIGQLEAGTYLAPFDPPFQFTVPAGWQRSSAEPGWFVLQPVALADTGAWIMVCRDTHAVDAANNVVADVGSDAASITTYVAGRTDLRNATGTSALNLGGLDGHWLDFDGPPVPPGEDIGDVAVVGPDCGTNAYDLQFTRLGVFDMPGGGNVLVVIASPLGDHGVIEVGTPIVESFVFELPSL